MTIFNQINAYSQCHQHFFYCVHGNLFWPMTLPAVWQEDQLSDRRYIRLSNIIGWEISHLRMLTSFIPSQRNVNYCSTVKGHISGASAKADKGRVDKKSRNHQLLRTNCVQCYCVYSMFKVESENDFRGQTVCMSQSREWEWLEGDRMDTWSIVPCSLMWK